MSLVRAGPARSTSGVMEHDVYFSWSDFDLAVLYLAEGLEGLDFDSIYGIPRGGLVLAVTLSHQLCKPLTLIPDRRTLVVDDISDSGRTLQRLKVSPACTATIHYVPGSAYKPTVWALYKSPGTWIVYPWERPF